MTSLQCCWLPQVLSCLHRGFETYVTNLLRESNLVDLFRYFHPDKTRYTWRQRNKLKQARLDYFIVSSSFTDLTISTDIKPGYRTDHSMLELNVEINNFRRGRGTWKLNTSLLKDNQYLQLINDCIRDEYIKYAVPIYEYDYLKTSSFDKIQLTIDDNLFLEMLLVRIRGESIKYGTYKKKVNLMLERNLMQEIEQLEKGEKLADLELLEEKKPRIIGI